MRIFLIHIWLISNGVTSVCFAVDNKCKTLLIRGSGITVYGQIGMLVSLSTNKSYQHTNNFERFRWHSVMAVGNNDRKLLTKSIVYRSISRTLNLSVDHYSFPLLVTWKLSSNFPFQWTTSSLATITFFSAGSESLVFWKSAKLISTTESSFHSRNKSSRNMQRKISKGFQKRLSRGTKVQLSKKIISCELLYIGTKWTPKTFHGENINFM